MTTTKTRIHTTEMALENVSRDGDTWRLGSADINGHTLPALTYDASEETILSRGGQKFTVWSDQFEHWGETHTTIDIEGEWGFGSSAKGHEKMMIQMNRARALIHHALNA